MKINPIGLQSYQEIARRDNQPAAPEQNSEANRSTARETVNIKPQDEAAKARLALKAPRATYADNLSPQEQRAMELLFSRFRSAERFGPGYIDNGADEEARAGLGGQVDVKA